MTVFKVVVTDAQSGLHIGLNYESYGHTTDREKEVAKELKWAAEEYLRLRDEREGQRFTTDMMVGGKK